MVYYPIIYEYSEYCTYLASEFRNYGLIDPT
jgi:hypothetical protein